MKITELKVVMLSMSLVVGMMLPVSATAQENARPGGLFGYFGWFNLEEEDGGMLRQGSPNNEGNYNLFNEQFGSDDNGGYNLYNQSFEEAPLGSGLLILTAAGAGYALKKRKSNIKTHKS